MVKLWQYFSEFYVMTCSIMQYFTVEFALLWVVMCSITTSALVYAVLMQLTYLSNGN